MRILYAEDDRTCGVAISSLLELLGHDIEWFDSGAALYDALAAGPAAQVLLLDLGLGDEDGVLLIERARAAALEIPPIVVFSARSQAQIEHAALQLGAVGILRKPCTSAQMVAMFHRIDVLH